MTLAADPSMGDRSSFTEGTRAWPSVSVVIPTRNRPQLLLRAVRAVIEQEYPGHVECVVVFDQSAPQQLDVSLPANRTLHCIANVRTPGLPGARNSGAFASHGDLLAFCDDDDEWLREKLRRQVKMLDEAPDAVVVSSGIVVRTHGRDVVRIPDRREITFRDLLRSRWVEVHPSNIMLRREDFLGRVGLADEQIPGGQDEDYEFLLRATRHGPIAIVRAPLVRINWHASSWFAQRWRSLIAAHLYVLDRYPEFSSDRRGLARMYGQLAFYHAAVGDRRSAVVWASRTLRAWPLERRAYVALVVAVRPSVAGQIVALANRAGRGI